MKDSNILEVIWPLLAAMRVLGWFPARRRHGSATLHHDKYITIYSVFVVGLIVLPSLYIFFKGLLFLPYLDPKQHMITYVEFFCGVLGPQLMSIFAANQAKNHITFWNDIQLLQVFVMKISPSKKSLNFNIVRTIAIGTVVSSILPIIFIMAIVPMILQYTPTAKLDLVLSLSIAYLVLLLGWWFAVTSTLSIISQRLIEDFKLLCTPNINKRIDIHLLGTRALRMRATWLKLCLLVKHSGNTLWMAMANLMLNSVTVVTYLLYELLSEQFLSTTLFFGVTVCFGVSLIYVNCLCAHNLKMKLLTDLLIAIKFTNELQIKSQQMLDFFKQLSRNQKMLRISLSGYVFLDKKLVSTLMFTIATNMMVLYQLQINKQKLELRDILTFGGGNIL